MEQTKINKLVSISEPYVDDHGCVGFATVDERKPLVLSMDGWRILCGMHDSEFFGMDELLQARLRSLEGEFKFASTPSMDDDLTDLHDEIARYLRAHIWFPESGGWYDVVADWVICTYISDFQEFSPRQIFYGPMMSGKTRAINTIGEIVYHGDISNAPSGAAVFRSIDKHHVSTIIDEYSCLGKERKDTVDMLLRGGWQFGASTKLCSGDDNEPKKFNIYGPMVVGSKYGLPDDIESRSIIITMMQKPSDVKLNQFIDKAWASKIRGRLLTFRLKVMSGVLDVEMAKSRAMDLIRMPVKVKVDGSTHSLTLTDRSADLAITLLAPSLMLNTHHEDTILKAIATSQLESSQTLRESLDAEVAQAIICLVEEEGKSPEKLTVSTIRTKVVERRAMAEDCGLEEADKVIPGAWSIGHILRRLSFKLKRKNQNKTYMTLDGFKAAYRTIKQKYGEPAEEQNPAPKVSDAPRENGTCTLNRFDCIDEVSDEG